MDKTKVQVPKAKINKVVAKVVNLFPHNTISNAFKAGMSAHDLGGIRVYQSPYKNNSLKSAWISGFRRAEAKFNEGLRLSARIQSTLPLEEVE
jgi:hypothetical protein